MDVVRAADVLPTSRTAQARRRCARRIPGVGGHVVRSHSQKLMHATHTRRRDCDRQFGLRQRCSCAVPATLWPNWLPVRRVWVACMSFCSGSLRSARRRSRGRDNAPRASSPSVGRSARRQHVDGAGGCGASGRPPYSTCCRRRVPRRARESRLPLQDRRGRRAGPHTVCTPTHLSSVHC